MRSRPTGQARQSMAWLYLLACCLAYLLWPTSLASAQAVNLAKKPANVHSTLTAAPGTPAITDDEFATIMNNALVNSNGNSQVLDAKFLFEQCYGGGMLSSLQNTLKPLKWVGGAASQWNETSVGFVTPAENAAFATPYNPIWVRNRPNDAWTQALVPQVRQGGNQTVLQDIMNATNNDVVGPNARNPYAAYEHPQWFSNNGDNIKFPDPSAQSYDIVLWAGSPDAVRHDNDLIDMYSALNQALGNTRKPINYQVLYANGAPDAAVQNAIRGANVTYGAATQNGLQNAMSSFSFPNNPNEEFLFYSTDHGGTEQSLPFGTAPAGTWSSTA